MGSNAFNVHQFTTQTIRNIVISDLPIHNQDAANTKFEAEKDRTRLRYLQLFNLIHHFDELRLPNEDFEFPDLLGAADPKPVFPAFTWSGFPFFDPSALLREPGQGGVQALPSDNFGELS